MKVIFLDIDGVLNSERLMDKRLSEGIEYYSPYENEDWENNFEN